MFYMFFGRIRAVISNLSSVLDDVPAGATVVGIPARVVRRRSVSDD